MKQAIVLPYDQTPAQVSLEGAGALSSGKITLACTSSSSQDTLANLSLIAYAVSAVN